MTWPMGNPDAGRLAEGLRDYLIANPTRRAFGTRSHSSQRVLEFQAAMGIKTDQASAGVVGPAERSAARDLGVLLPERPLPPRR